jgi:hypothetical protein
MTTTATKTQDATKTEDYLVRYIEHCGPDAAMVSATCHDDAADQLREDACIPTFTRRLRDGDEAVHGNL